MKKKKRSVLWQLELLKIKKKKKNFEKKSNINDYKDSHNKKKEKENKTEESFVWCKLTSLYEVL